VADTEIVVVVTVMGTAVLERERVLHATLTLSSLGVVKGVDSVDVAVDSVVAVEEAEEDLLEEVHMVEEEEEEVTEMEGVEEVATEEAVAVEDMVETVEVTEMEDMETVTTTIMEEATATAVTMTTNHVNNMLLLSLLSVRGNESPLYYLLSTAAFSDFAVSYCTLKRFHLDCFNRRK